MSVLRALGQAYPEWRTPNVFRDLKWTSRAPVDELSELEVANSLPVSAEELNRRPEDYLGERLLVVTETNDDGEAPKFTPVICFAIGSHFRGIGADGEVVVPLRFALSWAYAHVSDCFLAQQRKGPHLHRRRYWCPSQRVVSAANPSPKKTETP